MQPINLFDQTADVLTPSGKTIKNADLAADPFFGVLVREPCAVTYGERGEMLTLQPLEALKSMYGVTEEDPDAAVVAVQSKMDESDHRVKATMVTCESLQRQLDALGGMEPDTGNDARTSTIAQVRAFVMMAVQPMAATVADEDALSISTLWPEWSGDAVAYAADAIVCTGNQLWRCVQAHTSQAEQGPASIASPSRPPARSLRIRERLF